MIGRYDPHFIKKTLPPLDSCTFENLNTEILTEARDAWHGNPITREPNFPPGTSADISQEYGVDACRIAYITSPKSYPELSLLESAFRFLAKVSEVADGARKHKLTLEWAIDPWLIATGEIGDHLFKRNKIYPALASWRLAWKKAPIIPSTPDCGKLLAWTLLRPFAPAFTLWKIRLAGYSLCNVEELTHKFLPKVAIKIGIEKSSGRWAVFDLNHFNENQIACISSLPWVNKIFKSTQFTIEKSIDGWKISRLPQNTKSDNLFS